MLGDVGCWRCSTCSIHYPPGTQFMRCQSCEEPTSYFSNIRPDQDWEALVEYAKMHPDSHMDRRDPHTYRFDQFLRMGFTLEQAQRLANATFGSPPVPLYHVKVREALDSGCNHALAFDMFA